MTEKAGESGVAARKIVRVFVQVVVAAACTSLAAWRLGIIAGLQPSMLDELVVMGVPLIGYFVLGVFLLTAIAWIVGVLPPWIASKLPLERRSSAILAVIAMVVCLLIAFVQWSPDGQLALPAFWVGGVLGAAAAFWWAVRSFNGLYSGLLGWAAGIVLLLLMYVLDIVFMQRSGRWKKPLAIFSGVAVVMLLAGQLMPRLVIPFRATSTSRREWAVLLMTHSGITAIVAFLLMFFALMGIGWASAAIDIGIPLLVILWLIVAAVLAFMGWLVGRGTVGIGAALGLTALLWIISVVFHT